MSVYAMIVAPSFKPFDPNKPVKIYRRILPHWRQDGATYFITFHTSDSLPKAALAELKLRHDLWLQAHPLPHTKEEQKEINRRLTVHTESWLDRGKGRCPFARLKERMLLHGALTFFHGKRVILIAFVIMPNHVHAIVRPLKGFELEAWIGSVKQYVSTRVDKAGQENRPFWFEEAYDRIVRDEVHLKRCFRYIEHNPRKSGVPHAAGVRWLNPDWKPLGWKFSK